MAFEKKETQNYRVIENDIANDNIKQCYLLYGEEAYLKLFYKKRLIKAFGADDADNTMNVAYFTGKDIDVKELISLADTMPFFADYRTIIVSDSGFFKSSQDELADFVKNNLPDTTRLLFIESEVDKRSKMFKALKEHGSDIEFTAQTEESNRKWVAKLLSSDRKNMDPSVLAYFLQKTGNDMANIRTEYDKLISYSLNKDVITKEDIDAIVTVRLQDRVFVMLDSMSEKNQKKALHLYYELLALKTPPYKILSLITTRFNDMLIAKELKMKGYDKSGITAKMGYGNNTWRTDKLLSNAAHYQLGTLKEALFECASYDEKIKTGQITDKLAVEMLIVKYSK